MAIRRITMGKIIPFDKLNEDELKFVDLTIRLTKALGYDPANKGMLDIISDLVSIVEGVKK